MTEEQIRQNADAYAMKVAESHIVEKRPAYVAAFNAFMSGAHSRDEEIGRMNTTIRLYANQIAQLRKEIEQLRNPWISVEERLPEKWKRLKVYQGTGEECYSWITKDVFVIKDGWETPEIAFYDYDAKIWWSEFGDNIENLFGEPTHWMPIPQIEKGE